MNRHLRSSRGRLAGAMLIGAAVCLALSSLLAAGQKAEPRRIEVIAKRYTFEPSLIEVMQGEPVRLVVKAVDGMHGFAIKKLNVDKEILPNSSVTIDFVAKEAGEFPIMCSVICGEGHASMTGMLKVVAKTQQ